MRFVLLLIALSACVRNADDERPHHSPASVGAEGEGEGNGEGEGVAASEGEGSDGGEGSSSAEGEGSNDVDPCSILPTCSDAEIVAICQSHIDALAGCTSLPGNFSIYNNPLDVGEGEGAGDAGAVTSLQPLASLTSVAGTFTVGGLLPLTNIDGLDRLRSAGSVSLRVDTLDLSALSALTDAGQEIDIVGSTTLRSLHGLENLVLDHTTVSLDLDPNLVDISAIRRPVIFGLNVGDCGFADFSALGDDTAVTASLRVGSAGTNPTSLAGLRGVTHIDEYDVVGPSVGDLAAMDSLVHAGGIYISGVSATTLPALPSLEFIGDVDIEYNPNLVSAGPWGTTTTTGLQVVKIYSNAVLTSPPTLSGTVTGEVDITGNPSLTSLDFIRTLSAINAGPFLNGDLSVGSNASLTTATFDHLTIAGQIGFGNNPHFPSCRVDQLVAETGASSELNENNDTTATCN